MNDTGFDPNRSSLAACMERIQEALKGHGRELNSGIVTSRDEDARELRRELAIDNVPEGFRKYQLPVMLPEQSFMFITVADPDVESPAHSHDEGDGIRFIAGGSIIYDGSELVAGDWMFIPRGERYSFRTGPHGALMCYCYCCCCA
ncbi:cupin domain-containing protein [Pseudonocardia sp. C8]|uniref:cupin domain-containing protein n=1 Tax=Pseudonocardia sp. C8 TaxID=2762759 RepID=UPI0016433279|nr:cupin domain-containing protein [Pseudonocardia sp. C8]MBC3193901.1 cupin domain-containing protein [Pseudonocardia sp. C8]